MAWTLVFLSLLSCFSCITSQPTLTQPGSQSGSPGGTIKLSCAISRNPNYIGWVQQKSGEAPRFVHCDSVCNRGEGIPDRFMGTRSGNNGYLSITSLQAEDEADYFCSMGYSNTFHSETIQWGTETKTLFLCRAESCPTVVFVFLWSNTGLGFKNLSNRFSARLLGGRGHSGRGLVGHLQHGEGLFLPFLASGGFP